MFYKILMFYFASVVRKNVNLSIDIYHQSVALTEFSPFENDVEWGLEWFS